MLKIVGNHNLDHNWWSNLDKQSDSHKTTIKLLQTIQLTVTQQHTTIPPGPASQRYAM